MASEVKMPQLGMNQDSAVIVAWLKASGDAIAAGDALCEVETDKATVEIEASADGFLAGIRAPEGTDVPVGDIIAVIVGSEAEVADHSDAPAPASEAAPEESPTTENSETAIAEAPAPPAAPEIAPEAPRSAAPLTAARGKVLASPKAKRIAAEMGIDLAALRAQGVAEPIHVSDLSNATPGGQSTLAARVDGAALNALLDRSEGANRTRLFAAFAASAWRSLFAADDVGVTIRALDGTAALHPNPDRGGTGPDTSSMTLVDLCATRLASYSPACGGPSLCVAKDGEAYVLTLAFGEAHLPMAHAIALLEDIAARVEDPIRQLL